MTFADYLTQQNIDGSDLIQITGIILSTVIAIIAIFISVVTLRQNSKMIEESTRPVIAVYSQSINPGVPMFYLVVKNFGSSPTYMKRFDSDFDFTDCYKFSNVTRNYIEDFAKCVFAPGQSRVCLLDFSKFSKPVHFSIEYSSASKTYSEEFDIDLTAAANLPTSKFASKDKELIAISYSLQELLLKNL